MQSISELEELHGENEEKSHDGLSYMSSETEDDYLLSAHSSGVTPGLGVTTRKKKVEKRKKKMGQAEVWMSFGTFNRFRNHEPSVRSEKRRRLNVVFGFLLVFCLLLLLFIGGLVYYQRVIIPAQQAKALEKSIKAHAEAAKARVEMCRGIGWQTACDKLSGAGARRRNLQTSKPSLTTYGEFEEMILDSDDPTVTYDQFCLRVYRLEMFGNVTFPYHSSQLLRSGGNQSMALFIQHGAMRNAEDYFCSFKELMLKQNYRDFNDILIIAPDFNYEHDELVHPRDAFWNSTKPWGDWRVGAESDPGCCGRTGQTVSSFDVLDHMLAMLTSKKLFPNMRKISYVGHSAGTWRTAVDAPLVRVTHFRCFSLLTVPFVYSPFLHLPGGQMVQRYAVMSTLAALWDIDDELDLAFIIANPSSYTYLDNRRWHYNCGACKCSTRNCTCDSACTPTPFTSLGHPFASGAGKYYPCYVWNYDRWPYGIGSFSDKTGRRIPYALRQGYLGTERAVRVYPKLHVVYLVGQNDTCNDGLPVCDASCWKRENYSDDEWPCFRNQMDTRCQAMLQGPFRRARGHQYMRYLEELYGKPVHTLKEVPGVGHNASGMFGSPIGLRELFGSN